MKHIEPMPAKRGNYIKRGITIGLLSLLTGCSLGSTAESSDSSPANEQLTPTSPVPTQSIAATCTADPGTWTPISELDVNVDTHTLAAELGISEASAAAGEIGNISCETAINSDDIGITPLIVKVTNKAAFCLIIGVNNPTPPTPGEAFTTLLAACPGTVPVI